MFNPTEIIFAATDACNLHCPHCFIDRTPRHIEIETAKSFIKSCIGKSDIDRIGFSGGEPFLYFDFLVELTKFTVENNLMFDQIMTNGVWWKTKEELTDKLQKLYNAGYDGKIGLSWDSFHNQTTQQIETFISAVQELFGEDSINVQIVLGGESLPLSVSLESAATPSSGVRNTVSLPRNAPKTIPEYLDTYHPEISYYLLPQTFQSSDEKAWKSKKWFKDDYCEGPGQIIYVQPDGNIAPCCGFANENPQLFIGKITDSYEQVMENASKNPLIEICYEKGLARYRKELEKQKIKFPGKTEDICSFCDWVCKNRTE